MCDKKKQVTKKLNCVCPIKTFSCNNGCCNGRYFSSFGIQKSLNSDCSCLVGPTGPGTMKTYPDLICVTGTNLVVSSTYTFNASVDGECETPLNISISGTLNVNITNDPINVEVNIVNNSGPIQLVQPECTSSASIVEKNINGDVASFNTTDNDDLSISITGMNTNIFSPYSFTLNMCLTGDISCISDDSVNMIVLINGVTGTIFDSHPFSIPAKLTRTNIGSDFLYRFRGNLGDCTFKMNDGDTIQVLFTGTQMTDVSSVKNVTIHGCITKCQKDKDCNFERILPLHMDITELICDGTTYTIDVEEELLTNNVDALYTWTVVQTDVTGATEQLVAGEGFINDYLEYTNTYDGPTGVVIYTIQSYTSDGVCHGDMFTITINIPAPLEISITGPTGICACKPSEYEISILPTGVYFELSANISPTFDGVLQLSTFVEWQNMIVDNGDAGEKQISIAFNPSTNLPSISYVDTVLKNLKYASYNGTTWTIDTVDTHPEVSDGFLYTSLAFNPTSNYPSIAYYSYDPEYGLKYASYNGASWDIVFIITGLFGNTPSLAFDNNGNPHIAHYHTLNFDLGYASYSPTTDSWYNEIIDSSGNIGFYTSLAFDSNGRPHISYFDTSNGNLKYISYSPTLGWQDIIVDSTSNVGFYTSIALDSNDYPHISYYNTFPERNLKYASYSPTVGWYNIIIDSTNDVGVYTSLKFNPITNLPSISYYDTTNTNLKYAYYSPLNGWQNEIIDSTGVVGQFTSLAFDSNGMPAISYLIGDDNILKYAYGNSTLSSIIITPSCEDVYNVFTLEVCVTGPGDCQYCATYDFSV